jgi:hypothetical protein
VVYTTCRFEPWGTEETAMPRKLLAALKHSALAQVISYGGTKAAFTMVAVSPTAQLLSEVAVRNDNHFFLSVDVRNTTAFHVLRCPLLPVALRNAPDLCAGGLTRVRCRCTQMAPLPLTRYATRQSSSVFH